MRDALKRAGVDSRKFEFGQTRLIRNEALKSPEYALRGKAQPEKDRPILVLSTDDRPIYPIVLVAPITKHPAQQGKWDFRLKKGEASLDQDCVVQLDLIQPIAKVDLYPDSPLGKLSEERCEEVFGVVFAMLAPQEVLKKYQDQGSA